MFLTKEKKQIFILKNASISFYEKSEFARSIKQKHNSNSENDITYKGKRCFAFIKLEYFFYDHIE